MAINPLAMNLTIHFEGDNSDWESEELEDFLQMSTAPEAEEIHDISRKKAPPEEGTLGSLTLDILTLALGNGALISVATFLYNYFKDKKPTTTVKVVVQDGEAKVSEVVLSGQNQAQVMADLQSFLAQINPKSTNSSAAPSE